MEKKLNMIHVYDNINIVNTPNCYTLVESTGKIDKKTGKEITNVLGYHTSLKSALKQARKFKIKSDINKVENDIELSDVIRIIENVNEEFKKMLDGKIGEA